MTDKPSLQMPTDKYAASTKKVILAYNNLPLLHQMIVNILSIICERTARTNIVNSLVNISYGNINAATYTVKDLDPILKSLMGQGLVSQNQIHFWCRFDLVQPLFRFLMEQGLYSEIAEAVARAIPVYGGKKVGNISSYGQVIREVYIAFSRGNVSDVRKIVARYEGRYIHYSSELHPYVIMLQNDFDAKWIERHISPELHADIAIAFINQVADHNQPIATGLLTYLTSWLESSGNGKQQDVGRLHLAEHHLLTGSIDATLTLAKGDGSLAGSLIRGANAFFSDEIEPAIGHYETAFALLKKTTRKRKIYFPGMFGLFHILALIKRGTPQDLQTAGIHAAVAVVDPATHYHNAYRVLQRLIDVRQGDPDAGDMIKNWRMTSYCTNLLSDLIQILAVYWTDRKAAAKFKKQLKQMYAQAERNGYDWLAGECATLLSCLIKTDKTYTARAEAFFKTVSMQSMVNLIAPVSKWKQALNALVSLKAEKIVLAGPAKASRLVWQFDYNDKYRTWHLSAREQVKTAKGGWSKGRKIAMKRLSGEAGSFDFMTSQDREICNCIDEDHATWRGYPDISYYFEDRVLMALIGHPLVFLAESPSVQVEFVKGQAELLVTQRAGNKYEIAFAQDGMEWDQDIQLVRETPTRFKVIETGPDVRRIGKIIGKGLKVPAAGKSQLLQAVDSVAGIVTVQSQIGGIGGDAREMPADATPNLHLRPFGSGLKLELLVQPFAGGGPCFRPGSGGKTIVAEIDGKQLMTRRDLKREKALARKALAGCPMLHRAGEVDGLWEWEIAEPMDCLEALMDVQALGESVIVKWPEGQSFNIRQQADTKQFFMGIKKQKDWFAVSGELKLNDDLVLSMDELIALLADSQGRFIQMKDGQFIALTQALKKRLEDLAAYSKKSGKTRRFHPLAALSLEDLATELGGFRSDKHWKTHVKRLHDAQSLLPEIPSTFQAELRDYQVEGFAWLARLSAWGVGACLADDMGLGKTIQALAVMLTGAAKAPSLVVAPTSVCLNWEAEVQRFAPTLNIVTLTNGDREKILNGLAPFDLLLISYGLLQQEKVAEMLAGVHFQTIVLDEAQAIKNFSTKRSQAAMKLDGDFKLITTGTPIENHLGELWNLFRFINPGFLGSLKDFNQKFALPIEKYQDRGVRKRLKKLVQPFILRRTKSQVLEELPPRTDIVLQVELSAEELAFYEALRRRALETLADAEGPSKNKHLRILAEIMKLRQACCNARLVLPDAALPSAKLTMFGEIVEELLANGHKALVFSQFTSHLDIIRQYVESQSITYQYLDGSTPQKERKKRVNAFQDGQGDLFLISLKAGGLGLNLTAADYVIHMDPWWNPAVEQQASDRAHRIGQKRPVTVYSLVAKDTIEEKIVALHKHKRDLADGLLDGADMSGKMTAEQLLQLIKS